MNYRCKIFGSKVPDIILTYALIYPPIFNWKGYVTLKHQLYAFTTKCQIRKCALGLVLLVISIINNLCPKLWHNTYITNWIIGMFSKEHCVCNALHIE